jgi:hypothetical protein
VIDGFDEYFFLENDLCAMPMEIGVTQWQDEFLDDIPEDIDTQPCDEPAYPDTNEPFFDELPDVIPGPDVFPVQTGDEQAIPRSRVHLLLLVPVAGAGD